MTFKNTLYKQFLNTAENAGLKIISDEKCCQLLAWVYHIGGYTEESTHNVKLRESIFTAQKRLNILGGETPNEELLPTFRKYEKELRDFVNEKTARPQWLTDLETEYKIRKYNISKNPNETNRNSDQCKTGQRRFCKHTNTKQEAKPPTECVLLGRLDTDFATSL